MARKKSTTKKRTSKNTYDLATDVNELDTNLDNAAPLNKPKKNTFIRIALVVLLLAVVAGLLARRYKNWFVVASVNGVPIPRWTLSARLTNRFGNQMLEALIGEQLITQQAVKQNVTVSQEEVDKRISDIEKSLTGSVSLDESLKAQGLTRDEFNNQVRLQLLIDKMLASEVSVSASEVDEYLTKNASLGQGAFSSTDPAQRREEAEKELRSQKIGEKFVDWFNKLKQEAKVNRFL